MTPTYPETEDGFRRQLKSVAEAYKAENEDSKRRALEQFRIPDPSSWFAEHFGPDQSAKLAERYERLFENFATSLGRTMEDVQRDRGSELLTTLKEGTRRPSSKLVSVAPLKEPALYNFSFEIRMNRKSMVRWMDTFLYDGGAFRHVGCGSSPFWTREPGTEACAPSGGHFVRPPVLIRQLDPTYPLAAQANRVEGNVVLRVLIGKEGQVKNLKVLNGNPLLIDAAVDAVRQWRYKPGTLGGNPMESETVVTVSFKLSQR